MQGKITDLISRPLPEIPFWVSNILPKGGTLLTGGQAGIGKSFVAMEYMRAMATGTCLYGYPGIEVCSPCRVLYVEQELGEYGIQSRAKRVFMGENLSDLEERCFYVTKDHRVKLDTQAGLERLSSLAKEYSPDVMILDPVGYMMAGDENSNQSVSLLFQHLEEVRQGTNPAMGIILVHHFGKPPKSEQGGSRSYDPLEAYNFRGASAWKDRPDTRQTVQLLRYGYEDGNRYWDIRTRYVTRHGENPPELNLRVNGRGDLRVRWMIEQPEPAEYAPPTPIIALPSEPKAEDKPRKVRQARFKFPA